MQREPKRQTEISRIPGSSSLGRLVVEQVYNVVIYVLRRSHSGPVNDVAKSALGDGITVEPAGGAGYKSWEVIKGKQGRGKNLSAP